MSRNFLFDDSKPDSGWGEGSGPVVSDEVDEGDSEGGEWSAFMPRPARSIYDLSQNKP